MFKRGYLNREERNSIMVFIATMQLIEGIRNLEGKATEPLWDDWTKRGMMTKEGKKNLKLAHTYLKKFINNTLENVDKKENNIIAEKSDVFDFKLIDDYTLKKIYRDITDNSKFAVMKREDFINCVEDLASVNCVGCTKDYKECPLYDVFEDVMCGENNYNEDNCPYAANLEKLSRRERKQVNELKERMKNRLSCITKNK